MSSRRRLSDSLTDAFTHATARDVGGASVLFEPAAQHFRRIPIERIRPRADQPRRSFDDERLAELTESVRTRGVLQPIRVRPCEPGTYEIIAGERRWRAAKQAGLRDLPAVVVVADDDSAFVESLIENVQREDLNAVDRAHALQQLRVNLGLQSWEEVGRVIGITRQHVHNLLRIVDLPAHMQDDVRAGDLTEKHCRALLRLRDDTDAQHALWQRIHDDHLTGDAAIAESRRLIDSRSPQLDPLPPLPSRPRITVVVDALMEALAGAAQHELHAARSQLVALHARLGALLADSVVNAPPPVVTPAPDESWQPVLVPRRRTQHRLTAFRSRG